MENDPSSCDLFEDQPELQLSLKRKIISDFKADIQAIIHWFKTENDSHILHGSSILLSYRVPRRNLIAHSKGDTAKASHLHVPATSSIASSSTTNSASSTPPEETSSIDSGICVSGESHLGSGKSPSLVKTDIVKSTCPCLSRGHHVCSKHSSVRRGLEWLYQDQDQRTQSSSSAPSFCEKFGTVKLIDFNNVKRVGEKDQLKMVGLNKLERNHDCIRGLVNFSQVLDEVLSQL